MEGVAEGLAAVIADLGGKRVVVTGGASGIGAAIVREFSAAGVSAGVILDLAETLGSRAAT